MNEEWVVSNKKRTKPKIVPMSSTGEVMDMEERLLQKSRHPTSDCHDCQICHQFLQYPVSMPCCKHILCRSCAFMGLVKNNRSCWFDGCHAPSVTFNSLKILPERARVPNAAQKSDSVSSAKTIKSGTETEWEDPSISDNHGLTKANPSTSHVKPPNLTRSDSTDHISKQNNKSDPSKSSTLDDGKSVVTPSPPATCIYPVASTSKHNQSNISENLGKDLNLAQMEKCFFPNCTTSFVSVGDFAVKLHFVRHFAHQLVEDLPASSPYSCPICSVNIGNRLLLLVHFGLCHPQKLESRIKNKLRRDHLKVSYIVGNKNIERKRSTLLSGSKKYKSNCLLCGKIVNLCTIEKVERSNQNPEEFIQGALRYHLQSRHFSGFCPPMVPYIDPFKLSLPLRCPDCGKDMASKEKYQNHFMHRHLGNMFIGMTASPTMYDFFTNIESFTDLVELDMKKLARVGCDFVTSCEKDKIDNNIKHTPELSLSPKPGLFLESENSNSMDSEITKYCSKLTESADGKLKTSPKARSIKKRELQKKSSSVKDKNIKSLETNEKKQNNPEKIEIKKVPTPKAIKTAKQKDLIEKSLETREEKQNNPQKCEIKNRASIQGLTSKAVKTLKQKDLVEKRNKKTEDTFEKAQLVEGTRLRNIPKNKIRLAENTFSNTESIEGPTCLKPIEIKEQLNPIIIKEQKKLTENGMIPILKTVENRESIIPTLAALTDNTTKTNEQDVSTIKQSRLAEDTEDTVKKTEAIQDPTSTTNIINQQGNLTVKQIGLEDDTVKFIKAIEGPTLTATTTDGENLTEIATIPTEDAFTNCVPVAGLASLAMTAVITNGQTNLIETQWDLTRDAVKNQVSNKCPNMTTIVTKGKENLTKQNSEIFSDQVRTRIKNPLLIPHLAITNEPMIPVEKQSSQTGDEHEKKNSQSKELFEERNAVECPILVTTLTQDNEEQESNNVTKSRHSSTESRQSSEYLEEDDAELTMLDVKQEEDSTGQTSSSDLEHVSIKVEQNGDHDVNKMKIEIKEEIKHDCDINAIKASTLKEQMLGKKQKGNLALDSVVDDGDSEMALGVYALVFLEVTAIVDSSGTQYTQIGCHVSTTDGREVSNPHFFVAISPTKMAAYVDSLNHRDIVTLLYKMKLNFSGKESCYEYIKPDVSTIGCISEDNAMLELLVFLKRISFGLDGIAILHNSEKLVLPFFAKRRMQFSVFGDKHVGFVNLQEILQDYLGLNEKVPDLLEAHQRLVLNSIDNNPHQNADCSNTSKFLFEVMNQIVSMDFDNLVRPYCKPLSMVQKGEVWKNIILKKYESEGKTLQLCRSCEPDNPFKIRVTEKKTEAFIQTSPERQIENETTPKPDVREHLKNLQQGTVVKQLFPYSKKNPQDNQESPAYTMYSENLVNENIDMSFSSNESNCEKCLIENKNSSESSFLGVHPSLNPLFNPLYYSAMEPVLNVSSEFDSNVSSFDVSFQSPQAILPSTKEPDSPQIIADYSNKRLRLIDQQQLLERREPTEVQKASLSGITELTTKGNSLPLKDNPNCKCDTLSLCSICRCFQVFSDQNFSSDESVYTFIAKIQDDEGILVKKCIRFIENQALRFQGKPSPFSQVRRVYTGGKHILLTVETDQKVNIRKNDLIGICQIWKGRSHSDLQDHHQCVLKCGESEDKGGGIFHLTLKAELRPGRHLPVVVQTVPWLNLMTKMSTLTSEGTVKIVCKNVATIADRVPNVGDILAHATTRVSKNIIPSITSETCQPKHTQVKKLKRKFEFSFKKKVPNLTDKEDPLQLRSDDEVKSQSKSKRFKQSFNPLSSLNATKPSPQMSNIATAPKENAPKPSLKPQTKCSKCSVQTPQTCSNCPKYDVAIARSFAVDPGSCKVGEVRLVGITFPETCYNFVKLYVQSKYENYHLDDSSQAQVDQDAVAVIVKQVLNKTSNVTIYNGTRRAVLLEEGMVVGKGQVLS